MNRKQLDARRKQIIDKLRTIGPWIEGSPVETARYCGKEACACHHGGAKHPVLFITWKEQGKTVSLYIPRKLEVEVKGWIRNYRSLKDLVRKVSEVQRKVIRLRN